MKGFYNKGSVNWRAGLLVLIALILLMLLGRALQLPPGVY